MSYARIPDIPDTASLPLSSSLFSHVLVNRTFLSALMPVDQAHTTRVRRACDGCRLRKVKCDGAQPCANCENHGIRCAGATLEPERRKNPIRGRLVAKARGEITGGPPPSQAPLPASLSPSHPSPGQPVLLGSPSGPAPPKDFFRRLLPQFEQLIYPFNPAVSPADLYAAIDVMGESFEDAALIYAFGATTAFLTQTSVTMHGDAASQMNELLQYSLEAHRRADLGLDSFVRLDEAPLVTNKRIMTCIYLEIAMMAFKLYDRSFGHLREAITMIQVVQARQRSEETLQGADLITFQRLYWEAYIHERFLTIASGFPSILPPLKSGVPVRDPIIPAHIQVGFDRIIQLFTILDDVFLSNWDGRGDRATQITVDWIESKQVQLDQHEINAAESERELRFSGHDGFTELQHADLFITRLWIRTLLWQLALSKGFLRLAPSHSHEGLSLQFPALRLTTQLRSLVSRLDSIASISTQGSGILQKLFEITSTIADVLAVSMNQASMESHIEDFLYIARFLIHFERMREKHRVYLQEKMDTLRRSYPGLPFSPVPLGSLSQVSSPMDQL